MLFQLLTILIEMFIITFVYYRFIRWHLYYYNLRKNKGVLFDSKYTTKRVIYIRPEKWLKETEKTININLPIDVYDYSEGGIYYIKI